MQCHQRGGGDAIFIIGVGEEREVKWGRRIKSGKTHIGNIFSDHGESKHCGTLIILYDSNLSASMADPSSNNSSNMSGSLCSFPT